MTPPRTLPGNEHVCHLYVVRVPQPRRGAPEAERRRHRRADPLPDADPPAGGVRAPRARRGELPGRREGGARDPVAADLPRDHGRPAGARGRRRCDARSARDDDARHVQGAQGRPHRPRPRRGGEDRRGGPARAARHRRRGAGRRRRLEGSLAPRWRATAARPCCRWAPPSASARRCGPGSSGPRSAGSTSSSSCAGNNKDAPEEIPRLLDPIVDGADFVQGSRFLAGGRTGGMPLYRHFATRLHPLLFSLTARQAGLRVDQRLPRLPHHAARRSAHPPRPELARRVRARALSVLEDDPPRLPHRRGAGHQDLSARRRSATRR